MKRQQVNVYRLALGGLLAGFGALATMDRLTVLNMGPVETYWPLMLVALGLVHLADTAGARRSRAALWLLATGAWLTVNNVIGQWLGRYVGSLGRLVQDSWPAVFLVVGLAMLIHGLGAFAPAGHDRYASEGARHGS